MIDDVVYARQAYLKLYSRCIVTLLPNLNDICQCQQTLEQNYITFDDIETLARLIMLETPLGKSLKLKVLQYGFEPTEDYGLENCN